MPASPRSGVKRKTREDGPPRAPPSRSKVTANVSLSRQPAPPRAHLSASSLRSASHWIYCHVTPLSAPAGEERAKAAEEGPEFALTRKLTETQVKEIFYGKGRNHIEPGLRNDLVSIPSAPHPFQAHCHSVAETVNKTLLTKLQSCRRFHLTPLRLSQHSQRSGLGNKCYFPVERPNQPSS